MDGLPIGSILAIFLSISHPDASYQNTSQLHGLSFQEKRQNIDFQDRGHLGFAIESIFAILSTSHPDVSYSVLNQMVFDFGRRSAKQIFKVADMAAILDFESERYQLFLIYKSP